MPVIHGTLGHEGAADSELARRFPPDVAGEVQLDVDPLSQNLLQAPLETSLLLRRRRAARSEAESNGVVPLLDYLVAADPVPSITENSNHGKDVKTPSVR